MPILFKVLVVDYAFKNLTALGFAFTCKKNTQFS